MANEEINLDLFLYKLNQKLTTINHPIKLIVIGGYALHWHHFLERLTYDIDTINRINDKLVYSFIEDIGLAYGSEHWLNDQANGMILPNGFYQRLIHDNKYSHIDLFIASRIDLIFLKIAAYFYRGVEVKKDLEDLIKMAPSKVDIQKGLEFLRDKHRPDSDFFIKDFEIQIDEFSKKLYRELYETK